MKKTVLLALLLGCSALTKATTLWIACIGGTAYAVLMTNDNSQVIYAAPYSGCNGYWAEPVYVIDNWLAPAPGISHNETLEASFNNGLDIHTNIAATDPETARQLGDRIKMAAEQSNSRSIVFSSALKPEIAAFLLKHQ